jgi:AcrR family transcriptional regulator
MNILTQRDGRAGEEAGTTREKILHGACELFARQGFQDTTVQQICRKAGANIASVNYYFGSKGKLYIASWKYAARLTEEVGGPIDESLPPEEWLRRVVRQWIKVMFSDGPSGWFPLLIHNEIHNSSAYFNEVVKTLMDQVCKRFSKQVAAYLGPEATPFQMESAVRAIMGFMPMTGHMRHHQNIQLSSKELEELTRQTQAYILGGLKAVKRLIHKESTR